jgi:hypothetical protein
LTEENRGQRKKFDDYQKKNRYSNNNTPRVNRWTYINNCRQSCTEAIKKGDAVHLQGQKSEHQAKDCYYLQPRDNVIKDTKFSSTAGSKN